MKKNVEGFVGFTIGGNKNKKLVVSEETQKRLNKIFDSDSEDENMLIKLDQIDKIEPGKGEKKESFFNFGKK